MTRLILLPLEPLEERYTAQWYEWFPREFENAGFDVAVVDGERLTQRIETGVFLDVHSSYYWEFTQMQKVIKMFKEGKIRNGDVIFSMDIEFPGHFYALKYLAERTNKKVKCFGWLHAGSYTREDFVSFQADTMKYLEFAWLKILDGIFVASRYHRNTFIEKRAKLFSFIEPDIEDEAKHKVHAVGNPWYLKDAWKMIGINDSIELKPHEERDIDIIISDRPDFEKRVHTALALALSVQEYLDTRLRIAVTTARKVYTGRDYGWLRYFVKTLKDLNVTAYTNLSKKEYYELLSRSKIYLTTTIEENFGYCSIEAMTFNVNPILPNKFAFPEHVGQDTRFLYNDLDEAFNKIIRRLDKPDRTIYNKARKYELSLKQVIKIINRSL